MSEQLKKIKQLVELREKARLGGGEVAIDKQHAKGKATARERIALLVAVELFLLHAEIVAAVELEHVELFETSFVDE